MDIPSSIIQQMQTAQSETIQPWSSEKLGSYLEHYGWLRSVAGDKDFANAIEAINKARVNRRGLFVCGNPGCGKTQLMRTIFKMQHAEISRWLYCKDDQVINWMKTQYGFYYPSDIYLDDIGTEEVVKSYGNVTDVIGDFIQKYHEYGRGRMFITSNLGLNSPNDPTDINRKYGTRVMDRILSMCVCLKLNGTSKRERMMVC